MATTKSPEFSCLNCGRSVPKDALGTKNRNHCPSCLWSQHLDSHTPGDRATTCFGKMMPQNIVFKKIKVDKYTGKKSAEVMLAHKCQKCGAQAHNRIAGDDSTKSLRALFESTPHSPEETSLFNSAVFGN